MNQSAGHLRRIASFITGAAAVVTVGSVGYCVKVDHLEDRIKQLEQENAKLAQNLQDAKRHERDAESISSEPERSDPQNGIEEERSDLADMADRKEEEGEDQVPNPNPGPLEVGTEIAHGIKFQVLGCGKNGSSVLCDLQFTALERDIRDVHLTTDSVLNVSGDEVTATRASFGSLQNNRIHAWGDLVARVPKKGALRFEGIGVDAGVATLLELRMVVGYDKFSVRLRDVSLD